MDRSLRTRKVTFGSKRKKMIECNGDFSLYTGGGDVNLLAQVMEVGFNLVLNIAWWELGLVVVLLVVYTLAPAICVAAGGFPKKCVEEREAPTVHQGRGWGRGRGSRAG